MEAATKPRVTRPRVTRLAMEAATRPRVTRPRVTRLAMEAATRLVRLAMEAATRPSPWSLATNPRRRRRIFWRSPLCCACGGARRGGRRLSATPRCYQFSFFWTFACPVYPADQTSSALACPEDNGDAAHSPDLLRPKQFQASCSTPFSLPLFVHCSLFRSPSLFLHPAWSLRSCNRQPSAGTRLPTG